MEEIDEILIQLEDQLHGELGNLVTKARKLLAAKASPTSMPDDSSVIDAIYKKVSNVETADGRLIAYLKLQDAKELMFWMRSQCDGLIKQKAVSFVNWLEHNDDGMLTTEEKYEIFNQQER